MDEIVSPSFLRISMRYLAYWAPLMLAVATCGCVALPHGIGGAPCGPNCGEACENCPPEHCETCPTCGSCPGNGVVGTLFGWSYSVCHVPSLCVGCVANFCGPPSCVGPPDVLPPGRFFPVPTQPAFAPRNESQFGPPEGQPASL